MRVSRIRRFVARTVAVAAVATLLPATAPSVQRADAAPPNGLFTRASNAVQLGGDGTVYARVATDGQGTFHSITRMTNVLGQWLVYKRSTNAGRTWQTAGMFQGPDGGATRPEIAVDGPNVAVAFIGALCDGNACQEVPMLVTSADRGLSWKRPLMLSPNWGTSMAVAQSGSTTWVAWERPDRRSVAVRRTNNGTVEFSGELNGWSSPLVQASGSFALFAGASTSGTRLVAASVPEGLGVEQTIPGALLDIALADRTGHAMVRSNGAMNVWSFGVFIGVTITPGTPVAIGTGDVWSGDLDARRGLLAATWTVTQRSVDRSFAEAYVSSSKDKGATFGPAELVADNPNGVDLSSRITIGASVGEAPIATFNWEVAAKYTDGPDDDSLPEPANALGDLGRDRFEVARSAKVTLDGCDSIASPGRTIAADAYEWAVDGLALDATGCTVVTTLPANTRYEVTLTVRDSADQIGQTEMVVEPKDMLVVSIGDSVASGEGSPHSDSITSIRHSETWQDQACHRSAYAGPALAARQLEEDDEHSSVTFVQLACSGAAIMDVPEIPGSERDLTDDLTTGGLLDEYEGVEPLGAPSRPGQLDQLDQLRNNRSVDVLMLSIGANDVKFSEVVEECLVTAPGEFAACSLSSTKTRFDTRITTLPSRYAALATRLGKSGIDPSDVFITEYFDQTSDEFGLPNLRCAGSEALVAAGAVGNVLLGSEVAILIAAIGSGGLITDDEARFARDYVGPSLNRAVATAASTHFWNYVGGIASQFYKHGYCAEGTSDPWVVRLGDSLVTQHDLFGSFHPNRDGQEVYGDTLFRSIRSKGLLINSQSVDEMLQGDAIGDVYVLASTNHRMSAVALRDGGKVLVPVGARELVKVDTGIDASAMVAATSPIAASGLDAVAVWNEGRNGWSQYQTFAIPVAIVDNVTVRNSRIVQAPIDSTKLLSGRPLVVTAGIDAHLAAPVDAKVRTVVEDETGVLFDSTELVRLEPGVQTLVLPASGPLIASGTVNATVTIEPLPNEPLVLHTDNEAVAPQAQTQEGRKLLLTIVPTNTESSGSVTCGQAAQTSATMIAFTEAVLPVMGVQAEISCTPPAPLPSSSAGIWQALLELDEYAQLTGRDAVVGVVPDGWLRSVADGAIGISAAGLRSMLVERSASTSTLAHEFAHTRGIFHPEDAVAAGGVWVARRQPVRGQDLMNPVVVPTPWVGKATWEQLMTDLGGPSATPQPPDFSATGVTWIRGAVWPNPDGGFDYQPGRWASPNDASYPDDKGFDELELERLRAVQVDTDTVPATTTFVKIALTEVDGLFGAGADPTTAGPFGQVFAQRLVLMPGVDRIDMVLDGEVVESRLVTPNAPSVTVTSPVAGTVVGSNEQVDAVWEASDPDGDSLTYAVLISPDGGATWRPVATGVTTTSLSFPSPEDIDSENVVVRVVASDGVRSGYGDSAVFTVLAAIEIAPPRVVFVKHQRVTPPAGFFVYYDQYVEKLGQPGMGLFTMSPNGTDVQPLVPYTLPLPGSPFSPLRPFWNADATQATFDAMTSNGTRQLFIVNRDGSGLRQVTNTDSLICASWHPDGSKLLTTDTFDGTLRVVDLATGALLANLGQSKTREWNERAGCPRYSPDGTRILVQQDVYNTRGNLALIDAITGERLHVDDAYFGGYVPIWSPDGTLAAAQNLVPCEGFFIRNSSTFEPVSGFGGYTEQEYQVCMGSMGFLSNSELWFTSTNRPWPVNYTKYDGRFYLVQEPVGRFCTTPISPERSTATCYLPNGTGTPVSAESTTPTVGVFQADYYPGVTAEQAGSGRLVIPTPPPAVAADAGGPYAGVVGSLLPFSAAASTALLAAGAASAVAWDLDGDGAFDDATGVSPEFGYETAGTYNVKVRITPAGGAALTSAPVKAVISPLPAQNPVELDDSAAPPVVAPLAPDDVEVTVPMDATSPIRLQLTDGSTTRFTVDRRFVPEEYRLDYARPSDPWEGPSTGDDGVVSFTPPAGFIGQVTFTFERSDVSLPPGSFGTVTVDVRGNRGPVVRNDVLTVPRGSVVEIDPATLLANDEDPDPVAPTLQALQAAPPVGMSVLSIISGTNTNAWLGTDGTIRLRLDGSTGTFAYVAGDPAGGLGLGSVTVEAFVAPTPTTTPVPPSSAMPTTTGSTTTTTATTTTPAVDQVSPVPEPTPQTPVGRGELPATGADSSGWLQVAFWLTVLGGSVVMVTRRRRRTFR